MDGNSSATAIRKTLSLLVAILMPRFFFQMMAETNVSDFALKMNQDLKNRIVSTVAGRRRRVQAAD